MKQESWQDAECPHCGYLSSANRKFCPNCGFRVLQRPSLTLVWVSVLMLITAIIARWMEN